MAPRKNPQSRPHWWRRFLGFATVAVLIAVGGYLSGWWFPNGVTRTEFPIQGIDVSRHQGTIDWSRISSTDVQFVYIKATEGGDFRDDRFAANWKASHAAGLRRGAYHYFTFKTSGARQAENFIATVPVDAEALPPSIDVEYYGNSPERPTVASFQRELSAFIAKVRSHYGAEPVIYTAREFQNHYLAGIPQPRIWFRAVITSPRFYRLSTWTFWQFTEKVRIPGITGFVDRNVYHGTPEEFAALCHQGR
jgi:lysozyme